MTQFAEPRSQKRREWFFDRSTNAFDSFLAAQIRETAQLFRADHINQPHGGIDSDAIGQRRLGRSGVDVVIPLVVFHQLGKGIRPTEKIVHDIYSPSFVGLPHRTQAVAQRMDGAELTVVPTSASGPAPEHDERVEIGQFDQLLGPVAAAVNERRYRRLYHRTIEKS